jgi:metallo-beta-lactamase class B
MLGVLNSAAGLAAAIELDPPIICTSCEAWNLPHEPFQVYGNTYYVGVGGLSSILIASSKGLILIEWRLAAVGTAHCRQHRQARLPGGGR